MSSVRMILVRKLVSMQDNFPLIFHVQPKIVPHIVSRDKTISISNMVLVRIKVREQAVSQDHRLHLPGLLLSGRPRPPRPPMRVGRRFLDCRSW